MQTFTTTDDINMSKSSSVGTMTQSSIALYSMHVQYERSISTEASCKCTVPNFFFLIFAPDLQTRNKFITFWLYVLNILYICTMTKA
jgi:hypothetical protein